MFLLSTMETALLPNDDALPTADASTECFEEKPLAEWYSPAKFGPHVSFFLYQFLVLTDPKKKRKRK
jgi:hypothetical protein